MNIFSPTWKPHHQSTRFINSRAINVLIAPQLFFSSYKNFVSTLIASHVTRESASNPPGSCCCIFPCRVPLHLDFSSTVYATRESIQEKEKNNGKHRNFNLSSVHRFLVWVNSFEIEKFPIEKFECLLQHTCVQFDAITSISVRFKGDKLFRKPSSS